ncbi:MAG: hypothetical protein RLZZ299_1728 [Pseudomonadota bacterium]
MSRARVAALLALAGIPVLVAASSVPRADMKLNLKEYRVEQLDYAFPSGLRVVFQEDHAQPMVSITAVNDEGSTADPPGREGIAHVVEHLWFRSIHPDVNGKPLPKVWDLLEEMGANLNAFTADDQTVYMTVAPSQHLRALLALEGYRMRDAVRGVGADVLQVEREVVRNELRMRYENDAGAVFGQLNVRLFPKDHPSRYGAAAFAGIGNNDSLNAITMDDMRAFVKKNYGPSKTTIFVVGDIDASKASEYLQDIGLDLLRDPADPKADIRTVAPKVRVDVTAAPEVPPEPVEPAEVRGKVRVTKVKGAVDAPLVAIGWSVPSGWRQDQFMMQIAASQVTPAIYSEINTGWQAGDGPIEGLGCGLQAQLKGSVVLCTIELKPGQDGQKIVGKALDGLSRQWQPTEDQLLQKFQNYLFEYGRQQVMAGLLQDVDQISSLFSDRVTNAAMYAHYTGSLQYYSDTFTAIRSVNPKQIQQFAQAYLNRKRAVAVIMEPYQDGDVKTDSSDAQYRGARREDALESGIPVERLTPELVARTVVAPDQSKIVTETLPNGMQLVVMPYTNGPLMQARMIFGGGTASMPDGEADFADAMKRNDSYRALDSLALAGFDGMGMDALTTELSFSGSAGNVRDAMYVLHERLDQLLPDTNDRNDWLDARADAILDGMEKPEVWASREQMRRVIPNHPLSDTVDHADLQRMRKWGASVSERVYRAVLQPKNATLVIVGNVTREEVRAAVDTYFANWAGWNPKATTDLTLPTRYPAATEPGARQVVVLDKKNSSQTNVNYLCQLTPVRNELIPASQVLGSVLSQGAWLALREQTGASYGAYAYTYDRPAADGTNIAFLGMTSLVQNDAAGLAAQAFLGLGESAKAGKIDPKLVAVRKYAKAQEYALGQQSTAQMAERLAGQIRNGLGFEWFDRYPKLLGAVTVPQMTALLDRCVGHEVVTLVGPKDVVSAKLTAANVPHEVFDWDKARLEYAAKHALKDVLKAEEKRKADEAKKTSGG